METSISLLERLRQPNNVRDWDRLVELYQPLLLTWATRAGLHPAVVECFVEFGLLEPVGRVGTQWLFELGSIGRLRTILLLRRDLGANLSSVAVILELLDRLAGLQRENAWLRSQR